MSFEQLASKMLSLLSEQEQKQSERERDPDEIAFMSAVMDRIRDMKGRTFPVADGSASLTFVSLRKPVEDAASEAFEFLLPLVVSYNGKANGEQWAALEKGIEADIKKAISEVGAELMEEPPTVTLVRRRKTDPYKDDPKSLTLLRFRVE